MFYNPTIERGIKLFNQYGGYPAAYPMQVQQNPQYQQRYDMYQQPRQQMQVVQVNGRSGAESYQLAANSSVLLLDETAPIVWFKRTDGAGYPTLEPYSISPYVPETPVDTRALEQRISKLEAIINEKSDNSGVDTKHASKSVATDAE